MLSPRLELHRPNIFVFSGYRLLLTLGADHSIGEVFSLVRFGCEPVRKELEVHAGGFFLQVQIPRSSSFQCHLND